MLRWLALDPGSCDMHSKLNVIDAQCAQRAEIVVSEKSLCDDESRPVVAVSERLRPRDAVEQLGGSLDCFGHR